MLHKAFAMHFKAPWECMGRCHHISPSVCTPHLFPLGPPSDSSNDPVVPTESVPPGPGTPAACDPTLSFDAISTLRGEFLFFKDRSDQKITFLYLFFWCTMLRKENRDLIKIFKYWKQKCFLWAWNHWDLVLRPLHSPKSVKLFFKDLIWFLSSYCCFQSL